MCLYLFSHMSIHKELGQCSQNLTKIHNTYLGTSKASIPSHKKGELKDIYVFKCS